MTGLGRPNFEILRAHGARIVTVSEEAIVAAARFLLERMKLVVEPSAATVLAALRREARRAARARASARSSAAATPTSRWLARTARLRRLPDELLESVHVGLQRLRPAPVIAYQLTGRRSTNSFVTAT